MATVETTLVDRLAKRATLGRAVGIRRVAISEQSFLNRNLDGVELGAFRQ